MGKILQLRDLPTSEKDRILYMQKVTLAAWRDRKNPDDGVIRLTEAQIVKRPIANTIAVSGFALLILYAAFCTAHFTMSLFAWALS